MVYSAIPIIYTRVFSAVFSQHRPPMKKVRKSLALDVIDCQLMPTHKRKSLKTEAKHSIKVKKKKKGNRNMLLVRPLI